jgi:hypothetical protein
MRADSDEAYVISLCDETLGVAAIRQHKFDFLLGDVGKNGQRRRLPVDAYYPDFQLVVEYREKQHMEAVSFFDKPNRMTISGVHRGQQRVLYDQRRREVLPQHGIQLVEFSFLRFECDFRQRLRRVHVADMKVIKGALEQWI